MSALLSSEEFFEKVKKVHKNRYDYSKTIYVRNRDKITVICKEHGEFQVKALNHSQGQNCFKCAVINNSRKLKRVTTDKFIERANKIHKNQYDYSKVICKDTRSIVTITCKIHGDFNIKAANHLDKKGCRDCSFKRGGQNRTFTQQEIIEKFKKVHGNKYNYDLIKYVKAKEKVKIICKYHGVFEQQVSNHYKGSGCPKCKHDFSNFKRSDWVTRGKNRKGIFYIIRCWNDTEEFHKLGITYFSVKRRYSGKHGMPYNYEIIKEVVSHDLSYIWNLEKRFKRRKAKQRYDPKIQFAGCITECFELKCK